MALYLYDEHDQDMAKADLSRLPGSTNPMALSISAAGKDLKSTRMAARAITHSRLVIVPDDPLRHTPQIEALKLIARLLDVDVLPVQVVLTRRARNEQPALSSHTS